MAAQTTSKATDKNKSRTERRLAAVAANVDATVTPENIAPGSDELELALADLNGEAVNLNTAGTASIVEAGANADANTLANFLDGALSDDVSEDELNDPSSNRVIPENTTPVAEAVHAATPAPAVNKPVGTLSARPGVSAKTSEKITYRLGEKAGEYLLLETADAALSGEELKKRQEELLKSFDATRQIKVKEKMVQLFGYLSNGGKLNEVMRRAFLVLLRDDELTSGDKGNLHKDLLAKPYSVGTARAQAGQIFSLFPLLKIVKKNENGIYMPNPDSVILQQMKAALDVKKK